MITSGSQEGLDFGVHTISLCPNDKLLQTSSVSSLTSFFAIHDQLLLVLWLPQWLWACYLSHFSHLSHLSHALSLHQTQPLIHFRISQDIPCSTWHTKSYWLTKSSCPKLIFTYQFLLIDPLTFSSVGWLIPHVPSVMHTKLPSLESLYPAKINSRTQAHLPWLKLPRKFHLFHPCR